VLEDRLLVWRLRRGNAEALCRVYDKYREDLLRLAVSLSNDAAAAEDIVHDVFVSFIRGAGQFRLSGSLKAYLAACVANRARNLNRAIRIRRAAPLAETCGVLSDAVRPDQWIVCSEELRQVAGALATLPCEQREAITLHLQAGMRFREIAQFQHVPLKTAISRYRCGLQKMRSLLNGEVTECDR
jgi:RNA polymerase sigma-70 factor (ECF subfamily)